MVGMPQVSMQDEIDIIRRKGEYFFCVDSAGWTSKPRIGKYKSHAIVFNTLADIVTDKPVETFYFGDSKYFDESSIDMKITEQDFIALVLGQEAIAYASSPEKFTLIAGHMRINDVARYQNGIAYAAAQEIVSNVKEDAYRDWVVLDQDRNMLSSREYKFIKSLGASNGHLCFIGEMPGYMCVELDGKAAYQDEEITYATVENDVLRVLLGKKREVRDFKISPSGLKQIPREKPVIKKANTGYCRSNRFPQWTDGIPQKSMEVEQLQYST